MPDTPGPASLKPAPLSVHVLSLCGHTPNLSLPETNASVTSGPAYALVTPSPESAPVLPVNPPVAHAHST